MSEMDHLQELAGNPVAFDGRLEALYERWEQADAQLKRTRSQMHALAGDRGEYVGRRHVWRRTHAEVGQIIRVQASRGNGRIAAEAAELLENQLRTEHERATVVASIQAMDRVYLMAPWNRFFPCRNRDGHIHSSLRECQSVRYATPMGWRPDLSGRTVAEAVADLGEALCTFCFHDAPSDWKAKTLGQVADERTAAERAAARAARDEVKWDKKLRPATRTSPGERFRCDGNWVETAAGAKEVLRREVEFRDYYGHGEHCMHAAYLEGARQARIVLVNRESAKPGTGATQEQIDRIIASAVMRNIKAGARLNLDGSVKTS
jgi:hypothetical protein